ncbi:MAG: HEAT repeat domain-containing protein [Planctomycetota bacterium]
MGGELDPALMVAGFANAEKRKAKGPLSYDIRQSPLAYLAMASGEGRLAETVDPLIVVLGDRDIHAAVAAARALGKIGGDGLSKRMLEAITPETPWPVRLALYESIGANPDPAAVPLLLERFEIEPGRLRQDVLYALLSHAADDLIPLTIEGFNEWWQASGQSFEPDIDVTRAWRETHRVSDVTVDAFAGFYETAVISDNLVFAFDASKSINDQQLALLKSTLTELFESLPAEMRFNVIDFGGHVRMLAKGRMVEGKVKERALGRFLQKTELTFGTWIFEAIELSMDLPEVDTVHFLSDGQPWGSELNNWQRTDYATRVRCATVPVAVNVILTPKAGNPEQIAKRPLARQMKRFAEAHAGRFQIIVPEAE